MDKQLRDDIIRTVRDAEQQAAEMYNERWVSGSELCKQICMITKDWLDKFGWKLPREKIEVNDNGTIRASHWGYPLHQIQRMIAEGRMRSM